MRSGRTLAFVAIALLAGGIVSQLPSALGADSGDPLTALWEAIFDLQSNDEELQAQIDELRVEGGTVALAGSELVSDLYAVTEVEVTEDGRTLVHITAGNSGSERAAGVKATAFYLMPLFEINSMDDRCEDKGRGIIECVIGTLEPDQESVITIDATARESEEENTWTVDVSTTTDDADYTNNHVTYSFETGSADPIETPEAEQPVEEVPEEPEVAPEPEQDGSTSNSTETGEQPSGNQTSAETGNESDAGGNQTSTEETPGDDGTSAEPEETSGDSGSNSTGTEGGETAEGTEETSSPDGSAQEEQPAESGTGEQEQSSDTGAGESPQEGSEEPVEGSEASSGEEPVEGSEGGEEPVEGSEGGEEPSQ